MLIVTANNENSRTILIPIEEMEKLGINDGDEVEISKEKKRQNHFASCTKRKNKKSFRSDTRNYRVAQIRLNRTWERTRMSESFVDSKRLRRV